MHGDEQVGVQVLAYFLDYYMENYFLDPNFRKLMDERMLIIMPTCNPSGYER